MQVVAWTAPAVLRVTVREDVWYWLKAYRYISTKGRCIVDVLDASRRSLLYMKSVLDKDGITLPTSHCLACTGTTPIISGFMEPL